MKHPNDQAVAGYRPEIDGLRGVAILAVLLHHVDGTLLPGGYVGVDVFFVISGFLITSLVARDLDRGCFSFAHFYARRAKRLIPSATVVVVSVLLAASLFFLPKDFQDLGASTVAYTTMLSNVLFWKWDDYFAAQGKVWPLLHTWSLAVEEQFYLVYPLLLWVIFRSARNARTSLLGMLAIASFGLSVWQSYGDQRSAYYLLPSRAWELLAGALCTRLPVPAHPWSRSGFLSGGIGATMIGVPMFAYSEVTVFPGYAALWPVLGTVLLINAATPVQSPWNTLLRLRSLVSLGLISYSLYLWHWPLIVFAKYPWAAAPETFPKAVAYIAGFVSLVLAALTYRYVEGPPRAARLTDSRVLLMAACVSGVVGLMGLGVHRSHGLPARLPSAVVAYAAGAMDFHHRRRETIDLTAADVRQGRAGRLGIRDPGVAPGFVLWGDSHADSLVPVLDALALKHGVSGIALTKGATPPLVGVSVVGPRGLNHDDSLTAAIECLRRERCPVAIVAAQWSAYLRPAARLRTGETFADNPKSRLACMQDGLRNTVSTLRAAGARRVWILKEVPTQPFHVPRALAWARLRGLAPPPGTEAADHAAAVATVSAMIDTLASDDVSIIDLAPPILEAPHGGLLTPANQPVYFDGSHVSVAGTALLRSLLEPVFTTRLEPATPSRGPNREP